MHMSPDTFLTQITVLQLTAEAAEKLCTLMKELQSHPNQEIGDQARNAVKLLRQ